MGTRIKIRRKEKKKSVCVILKHFQSPMLIYFLTLTVTATKVLVVNLVVLSLQLDSVILKVCYKLNGPLISVLSLTAKAFNTEDTAVSSLYHLQCQQTLWFTTCFYMPLIKEQTVLFINSICSRRAWEGKSNR